MATQINSPASFHEEARYQLVCAVCGRAGGRPDARGRTWHAHHVIERQRLRRNGKPEFDPRDALRLCTDCHMSHEWGGVNRVEIALTQLTDDNICFAFEALDAGPARVYLERHYVGGDPRIEQHEEGLCPLCQQQ